MDPITPSDFIGGNAIMLAVALFLILCVFLGVRIVPQSEKHVVERFGRLRAVLGPGINFIVPFLDRVAHKISVLERQLPTTRQDAITADNVLVQVDTSVFYRVIEPEKTVYRIRDIDAAIATTVAGIVRSQIGQMELDTVQSNRSQLITHIRDNVSNVVDDWGIEVTRTEILDVNLDEATRAAMLQQLNAERARRAQVTEAEAYATTAIADAIAKGGLEAAQYQVAMKQVETLATIGQGSGKQTLVLQANAEDELGDAIQKQRGVAK